MYDHQPTNWGGILGSLALREDAVRPPTNKLGWDPRIPCFGQGRFTTTSWRRCRGGERRRFKQELTFSLHQHGEELLGSVVNAFVCLLVGCLTSQQQASVSQGRICSDNLTCCHTEIEAADQTFYLTQSQYTDTGPTSPSADPITPVAWQGSHWSANFEVTGMTRPRKIPTQAGFEPGTFRSRGGRLNH